MHPASVSRGGRGVGARVVTGTAAALALVVLVVGPPWALVRFVGWPLPAQVPTVDEILAALSQPPGTALVLGVLACVCWVAWAAFILDVALAVSSAILDVTRVPRRHHRASRDAVHGGMGGGRGPAWRPGAALVGIVLVALLAGSRPTPPAESAPPPVSAALVHPLSSNDGTGAASDGDEPGTSWATVREPTHGVHDSLWRIAGRELHDPTRWPEVYQLNAGRPQSDGQALQDPDLIQPRWQLRLPITTDPTTSGDIDGTRSGSAAPGVTTPSPEAPAQNLPPHVLVPPAPAGAGTDRSSQETGAPAPPLVPVEGEDDPPWIHVGPTVAISAAFATLIAAALAVAVGRHTRRRRRSDDTEDTFPVLPVVREIAWRAPARQPDRPPAAPTATGSEELPLLVQDGQVEHVRIELPPADGPSVIPHPGTDPTLSTRRPDPEVQTARMPSPIWEAVLGAAHSGGGIGLAGPGADPALRALLLELLITESIAAHHDVPDNGPLEIDTLPARGARTGWDVVVCDDLPERLGVSPTQLHQLGVTLTELSPTIALRRHTSHDRPVIVLGVAPESTPPATSASADVSAPNADTQSVLVVAGVWAEGITVHVSADGAIVAGPTTHSELVGQYLPMVDIHAATELLDLAAHSAHDPDGEQPSNDSNDLDNYDNPSEQGAPVVAPAADNGRPRSGVHEPEHVATPDHSQPDRAPETHPNRPSTPATAANPAAPNDDAPSAAWTLTLLGPVTLQPKDTRTASAPAPGVTPTLSARMRDLLVYLAIHPNGVRRDAIVAALWPATGSNRPGNNLSSLIGRLNATLRPVTQNSHNHNGPGHLGDENGRIVVLDVDRYRLDNDLVEVDYWTFLALTTAAVTRTATEDTPLTAEGLAALHHAHALYGGPLGEEIDQDWILSIREATRRTYLDTTARIVRHYVSTQPGSALHILETARNLEPLNEGLYRDIMALQAVTGDNDGAAMTAALLESLLADAEQELDPATAAVAQRARSHKSLPTMNQSQNATTLQS